MSKINKIRRVGVAFFQQFNVYQRTINNYTTASLNKRSNVAKEQAFGSPDFFSALYTFCRH